MLIGDDTEWLKQTMTCHAVDAKQILKTTWQQLCIGTLSVKKLGYIKAS